MTDVQIQYEAFIKKALLANEDSWNSAPQSPYPPEKEFHYNVWWIKGVSFDFDALMSLRASLPKEKAHV